MRLKTLSFNAFLLLALLATLVTCKREVDVSESLAVGHVYDIATIVLTLNAKDTRSQNANDYTNGILEIRGDIKKVREIWGFVERELQNRFVDIKYEYIPAIGEPMHVMLRMRTSDLNIVQVNGQQINGTTYPPAIRGTNPGERFDCITSGCINKALFEVWYKSVRGDYSFNKGMIDLSHESQKMLARLILVTTESVRFHSIFRDVTLALKGDKHPTFPETISLDGNNPKPIYLLWEKLSKVNDKSIVALRTVGDLLADKILREQKPVKKVQSQGCAGLVDIEPLDPEVDRFFDFQADDDNGLYLNSGCRQPDPKIRTQTADAMISLARDAKLLKATQEKINTAAPAAKQAAVAEFNRVRAISLKTISTMRGVVANVKFAGGRILPVAGAAAEVIGFAFGIADVVANHSTGVKAAATILEGLGLAGAILGAVACGGCDPGQKAAAFFKGFFGIDFTAKARCAPGYEAVGANICRTIGCPPGYRDDGATCFKDAKISSADNGQCPWYDRCGLTLSKGCSSCPEGFWNDGCTCRLNPDALGKGHYWTWQQQE